MKLTPNEWKVLTFLAERYSLDMGVYPFAPIMDETGLDRAAVRRACRSLRRKGLTEFHRGCWTYDGEPVGSGYCALCRFAEIGNLTCDYERTLAERESPADRAARCLDDSLGTSRRRDNEGRA